MSTDKFEAIAQVLALADGGCDNCVYNLVKHMEEEFPDFPWRERAKFYLNVSFEDQEKLPHQRFDECHLQNALTVADETHRTTEGK